VFPTLFPTGSGKTGNPIRFLTRQGDEGPEKRKGTGKNGDSLLTGNICIFIFYGKTTSVILK